MGQTKMFNEIEDRSIGAILRKQNVISIRDFESAYQNRKQEVIGVVEDVSQRGEDIFAVEKEGKHWYLGSRYDAEKAAYQWAMQLEGTLKDNSVLLIFGLGDGRYIRKAMEWNRTCPIIIYEPCVEIFWSVFGRREVAELLEQDRVYLSVKGICENLFSVCLETFINYANYQLVQSVVLPNYEVLFETEYHWYMETYLYALKRVIFNRNTQIIFSKEMLHNMLKLSKDVIEQYSIVQLYDIVKKRGMEDMPAVLVAAGPSLDKNIERLKEIKDSVFILAVDTALNTTLKHGIIPDMTITVDGHKPLVLFEDERVRNIPIAVNMQSNEKVIAVSEAMRFYELSPDEYLAYAFGKIGKAVEGLPTGGSVANNACSLLVKMGFQTIIFMGLDLAYPNGQRHTFDAYHKEDPLRQDRKYVEIEDIFGNKVLTEANMQLYLKWFETYISVTPKVRFLDATEGGARIHGAEIYTMLQVVKEFSTRTYDKGKIWERIPTYLNGKEQQMVKDMIREIPNQLDELEKSMKEELRIYDKMETLNFKTHGTSASLMKMINKIMELNEFMEEGMVVKLLKYYAIKVDYAVKGQILNYDENTDMYTQIKEIIKHGRTLIKGYMDGMEEMRKDMVLFLEEFH